MKKTITAMVTCGALLVTAAPAQAAPKDPVRALKAVLVSGHGVRFTETTTLSGDPAIKLQSRKGTFQFNAKGIAASDIRATPKNSKPERTINVGRFSYISGGITAERLSSGTWYRSRGLPGGGSGFHGQVINPAEPKTLAALVKKGRVTRSAITGKITFKELAKVSAWFDASIPLRMHNDTKVSYTLTLSSAGLVSRVKSSYAATGVIDSGAFDGKTMTIDSRFTGWGAKVSIKAPTSGVSTDSDS
ncbi:hypothetical protein ABZ897_27405 [Nonomuraea sp. NPDC046802]|uniref:hypothetical protein n=1 Tax=Nonomuraea sp. NPDC046802 TaxID=3154919 RepID=UPI0033CA28B9